MQPDAPWREVTFSVVDLETTGLDPATDEIISFAAVTVSEGRVKPADARYQLVRPRHMPGPETIRIHGLRESDLASAPPLSEAIALLREPIAGRALVAHVAAIERAFLTAALEAHDLALPGPLVDTAALAIELRRRQGQPPPRRQPVSLPDLARSLGLPVHRPHHAEGDALTTAQVFIALASHLDRYKPQTLGSLQAISRNGGRTRLRQLASAFARGRTRR